MPKYCSTSTWKKKKLPQVSHLRPLTSWRHRATPATTAACFARSQCLSTYGTRGRREEAGAAMILPVTRRVLTSFGVWRRRVTPRERPLLCPLQRPHSLVLARSRSPLWLGGAVRLHGFDGEREALLEPGRGARVEGAAHLVVRRVRLGHLLSGSQMLHLDTSARTGRGAGGFARLAACSLAP